MMRMSSGYSASVSKGRSLAKSPPRPPPRLLSVPPPLPRLPPRPPPIPLLLSSPLTLPRPDGDIAPAAASSLRNALSVKPASCASHAVLSTALATASHPDGDITPATASSLHIALRVTAMPCAFIVRAVLSTTHTSCSATLSSTDFTPKSVCNTASPFKTFPTACASKSPQCNVTKAISFTNPSCSQSTLPTCTLPTCIACFDASLLTVLTAVETLMKLNFAPCASTSLRRSPSPCASLISLVIC
mmetsp:Transcript_19628/g.31777  ORF Transcript_19628/g.31777 Transcript_19628/m.31777 type:complete len:245 (+) Transcript_19628:1600-2334(+)